MSSDWMAISENAPKENEIVMTKISNEDGDRNEQPLVLKNRLWFLPDMSMYVYYAPTHWKPIVCT